MAKTYEQLYKELTATEEGKHKLSVVRNALIADTLDNFDQLFAIIPKSSIQILLGISFYAFPKKISNPGTFTLDEIDFLTSLFKVDFDILIRFLRKSSKSKHKRR